jgi:hypothetical protein
MKFTSKLDYVSEFLQLIEIMYILMVVNSIQLDGMLESWKIRRDSVIPIVTCPLVPVRLAILGKRAGLAMAGRAKRAKFIFFGKKSDREKFFVCQL